MRPYDLRHGFASRALDNAADLKCVAEIMGHANEKMIVRFYRHTSAKQRRKAVEAAPYSGAGIVIQWRGRGNAPTGPVRTIPDHGPTSGRQPLAEYPPVGRLGVRQKAG